MAEETLTYNPKIFDKKDLEEAKKIILTNERNITSEDRWENETPYLIESISNKISLTSESVIVDFGCGIGRLSREIIEKFGAKVVGVDISAQMREHATKYVNSANFQAVSPAQFKNMIFQGMRFDAAIAVWVLQHCIDPLADIAIIKASLKENAGLFVLNNIQSAIPTNKGWVSNKIDIFVMLENFFELELKQKLPISAGNETISKHTFEALYSNTKTANLLHNSQLLLQKARKAINNSKNKEAIELYLYALKINPLNFNAANNLGILYEKLQDTTKAIEAYKNAVRINPKFAKAVNNIAVILYKQKRYKESSDMFELALNIEPTYFEVYSNLGAALNKQKRYDEAIVALETSIEKLPKNSGGYTNLGNVYSKLYEYKKAQKLHEKAIELEPKGSNAYANLGSALKNQGLLNKAIENYKKALTNDPNFINAHFDLSTALLTVGEFKEGFSEYEWRFKKDEMLPHIVKYKEIFSKPMLKKDSNAKDKIVLLHSEQGFGDSIMFARFIPQIKEKFGCKIIFKARDELVTLFENNCGIDEVTYRTKATPQFDFHLPIMSAAYVLGIEKFEDISSKAYIKVDEKDKNLVVDKKDKNDKKINIGICWSASISGESYDGKVFDLKYFDELINSDSFNVYSFQVGEGSSDIKKYGYENKIIDLTEHLTDFKKSAILAQELDLIVTSDTSVAHLCGALGVKTWTLLQKYPDWRWKNKGEKSYMYNSMKLIRQKHDRNWDTVFQSFYDRVQREFKVKI
jgi:tetratricopeptide (TPR) repeat protein/ADP-heptose:LPS heptosyltransferase